MGFGLKEMMRGEDCEEVAAVRCVCVEMAWGCEVEGVMVAMRVEDLATVGCMRRWEKGEDVVE